MWSHHEKICVIDQKKAFVGGFDICFGRYDTREHPIKDFPDAQGYVTFPGQDYNNARLNDFEDVANYKRTLIDRRTQPRMPWHDVSLFVVGEVATDFALHFIEFWNHAKIDQEGTHNKHGNFLKPVKKLEDNVEEKKGGNLEESASIFSDLSGDGGEGVIGKDPIEHMIDSADEDDLVDRAEKNADKDMLKDIVKGHEGAQSSESENYDGIDEEK